MKPLTGIVRLSQKREKQMDNKAQAEMFETDAELKVRRFKLRIGCIMQYLSDERDSPIPLPVEINTNRVLGTDNLANGGRA